MSEKSHRSAETGEVGGAVPERGAESRTRWGCLWPIVVMVLGVGILVLAGFVFVSVGGLSQIKKLTTPAEQFTINGPTVNQIQSLSLLTVQSVQVVSDMEAEASFRKGTWLVRGSADYVVDFTKAELVERDERGKTVKVKLPMPSVRNARLDEQRTKLITVEKTGLGWWTIGMAGSQVEFEKTSKGRMEIAVLQAAKEEQFLTLAKQSAEKLVESIYDLAGWKVRVEWTLTQP